MRQRRWFLVLMTVVVTVCVVAFSGIVSAQGQSDSAFERVREVQERNTERMLAKPGVVGTAVGLDENGRHVVLILLEKDNVPDIPVDLEGIPVRRIVTGTINALPKGGNGKPSSKTPNPPTNLAAAARSSSQIDLTWTDNSRNETGFKIERTGGDAPASITVRRNVTSYSDTGLSASTPYTYKVCAFNDAGDSTYSDPTSATTLPASGSAPAAPTVLTATAVGSTQIDLAWTDNADNETGFAIERALDGVSFTQIATTGADVTTYNNSGLTASTTYTYRVRAYNATGYSGYSNTDSATTDAAPEPTNPWRFPRPVPIGVSTGHPSITAGTIGCRVMGGGTLYALSNNHVYAASNTAGIGDAVIQPGTFDDGTSPADDIGHLSAYREILWSTWPFITYNTVDAAIAEIILDDGVPRVGNATPAGGYGTPNSTTAPASELQIGQAVQKYGRTTGLTHGTIQGLNATIGVQYGPGQIAYFRNQIMIGPGSFSNGGDSGSLIVTDDTNCNPVGLLFAGSDTATYANPIDLVLDAFGVTIDDR